MDESPPPPRAQLLDLGQPLVLTGPPRAVSGQFNVQNPSGEKLRIREATIRSSRSVGLTRKAGRLASSRFEAGVALQRMVLRAGQSREVPVSLALDANTPPGTYHLELLVHDQLREVVMHVTEDVSLRIEPSQVVLPNRAGEKFTRRVVFSNDGNVPINVRNLGTIVLDDELASCRALRGALADVGDTMTTLDEFAAALGKRFKALYETLVIKIQNTAVTLEPGETRALDVNVTLPDSLDARARYTGVAAISTENLIFTIVPD